MAPTPGRRLARRLDNLALRWHAQLDSEWSDRSLPWILAGAGFVVLGGLALARARMLDAGGDLASYSQALWLISRGEPADLTLLDAHLLDLGGAFVLYPLSVLARLPLPLPETLLVVQSAALAATVVPMWRLARRQLSLRVGAATCLVGAYLLHPLVQALNLGDFHPESLAVPALVTMIYWSRTGSTVGFALAAAFAVACRADLALVVAGTGVLMATSGRRRLGLATTAVSLGWLVASLWISWLGAGTDVGAGAFAAYGDQPLAVVGDWLADPLDTLGRLTERRNFDLAVTLLLPVALLPLLALRQLAPALPWLVLVGLADAPEETRRTGLAAAVLPFLFAATAHGLRKLARPTLDRMSVNSRTLIALVATTAIFFVASSPSSPYASPWSWGRRDVVDGARLEAADLVADDHGVAATPRLAVLVAERRVLRPFPWVGEPPDDVDIVLVDQVDLAALGRPLPETSPPGFVERSRSEGVVTYLRPSSAGGR